MEEMPLSEPPLSAIPGDRAREYESVNNRLYLVRVLIALTVLGVYLFSGASAELANGQRLRFSSWAVTNALYTLITVFGFATIMFPITLYRDYVIEHRYGLSRQSLESWFADFLKSLLLELGLATLFFGVVYAFLRYFPVHWWLWASCFYILFAVVLTSIAPVLIMPLFHKFEPLDDPNLADAVKAFAEKEGMRVVGVYRWGLEEKTNTANAALAGLGRTRRIILGDTMLTGYSREEILAVLAHEIGHQRHRDMLRLMVVGAALALGGFYIAHVTLNELVARLGFRGPDDIAAFPVFIFCLFLFSLVTMPFSNAYSRRREFAADAYAVRTMGGADSLVGALEKLASQNLADRNPPRWIEFLLHSHPSISRRVARARGQAAGSSGPSGAA